MSESPPQRKVRLKRPAASPVEKYTAAALAIVSGPERAAAELGILERSVSRYKAEVMANPVTALELTALVTQKRQQAAAIILDSLPAAASVVMGLILGEGNGKEAQSKAVAFGIMSDKALQATAATTSNGRFGGSSVLDDASPQLVERRTLILERLRGVAEAPRVLELPAADQG